MRPRNPYRSASVAAAPKSGIGFSPERVATEAIDPPTNLDELFPIMGSLRRDRRLIDVKPAEDIFLIGRLHLTTSAIAAIDVLMAAGISPSNILLIAKDYDYAHGDFISHVLGGRGIRIVLDGQLSDGLLTEVAEHVDRDQLRLLTIEDGAEIVTRIHAKPNLLPFWIGGAEQTTRGLWRLEELGVQLPVVALPTSKIKSAFEGPHIAAAGLHAIKNFFPGICVADWRVAVLGLGTVGRHLLIATDELGCDVAGFDQDPIQRLSCRHIRAKAVKITAKRTSSGCRGTRHSASPSKRPSVWRSRLRWASKYPERVMAMTSRSWPYREKKMTAAQWRSPSATGKCSWNSRPPRRRSPMRTGCVSLR